MKVVLGLISLVFFAACSMFSPIRIQDVAISHAITVSNQPAEVVSIILPHYSDIYVSFYADGIEDTTVIRADWVYLSGEREEKVIESTEIALSEAKQVAFSVKKTKGEWPSGTYNVRIFVGDESQPRVVNSFIVI